MDHMASDSHGGLGLDALVVRSDAELRSLVQHVSEPEASEPFGAYVFGAGAPGADLARHLETTVFLESFGNTPALLAEEYGPYEASSVFICIIDHRRRLPAGVMRVLMPSERGFKSLNDIEPVWGEPAENLFARTGLAFEPERAWDIATFAVASDYRGRAAQGLVGMGLYQTLTLLALACGVGWFVAILDVPVFRLLRWKLRMIFAGYAGTTPRPYLGSVASIPAWCDVEHAERHLAATDPELHDILVQGVGLEPALRRVDVSAAERLLSSGPVPATGRRGLAEQTQTVTSRSLWVPSEATSSGI